MPIDAQSVLYTASDTTTIPIVTNQNLQLILQNIDSAINNMNPAPDYTGYNLYCVKQTDGITHPTNTQNFAEGISKILCDFIDDYNTFTTVTYAADLGVLTAAVDLLQIPALAYTHSGGGITITITNTMTLNQTLTAIYTPLGTVLDKLATPGNTWASLSISTPVTLLAAFNDLIAYLVTLTSTVSGKQATIANINNSANCLSAIGGTVSDTIRATVVLLTTYACDLPTFDDSSITWGCVPSQTGLQDTVQTIIDTLSDIETDYVSTAGTGLTLAAVGSCLGSSLAIDTTWTGLYQTKVTVSDTTPSYLSSKITAGTGISLAVQSPGANEHYVITNSLPGDGTILINEADATSGYIEDKLVTAQGTWGISINSEASSDDSTLVLTPDITNPYVFIQNIIDYIATDPALLAAFCALQLQCNDCLCLAPTNLVAVKASSDFDLTWVASVMAVVQNVKYRQRGFINWISNVNIIAANPQTSTATTATVSDLDTNTVYQFQVDALCTEGTGHSNIYESIIYTCQVATASVSTTFITITQPVMPYVEIISYELYNAVPTLLETKTATGLAPSVTFGSHVSGTYSVKFRYANVVNGTLLYSDDAGQLAAKCTKTGIVIA